MAEITAAAVKALREKTDLPMMECKKALVEAGGDEERAIAILQEQSGKAIGKRSANPTEEGRIFVAISDDGKQAAMVELQCESAPTAANSEFVSLGEALANQLLNGPGAADVEELLGQPVPGGAQTLREKFETTINKIREKFVIARVARVKGPLGAYVHHDGKTAVLFEAVGDNHKADVLRDVAMHIAAMKPTVANVEDVDPAAVQVERDRLTEEARQTGKPENIIGKIVDGRMSVFYRDEAGVLAEQAFAKDDAKTVRQVLAEAGLKPKAFTLWVLGN